MIEGVAALPKSGTKPQQKCAKRQQAKVLAAMHISFLLHIISVHMPLACEPCPWEQGVPQGACPQQCHSYCAGWRRRGGHQVSPHACRRL